MLGRRSLAAGGAVKIAAMVDIHHGRNMWSKLRPKLEGEVRREAAVAYVGKGAQALLNLSAGDVLMFDGSNSVVASGGVHLPEIARMMRAGVEMYSREGLHAKVVLIETDPAIAIVGSANASQNSDHSLVEAAAVFDDRDAVEDVRSALIEWRLGVPRVDAAWLQKARTIERRPRDPSPRWRPANDRPLIDHAKRLWLWNWMSENRALAAEVTQAMTGEQELGVWVESVRIPDRRDFDAVEEGESLLLVSWPTNARQPRKNSVVWEPARIARKLDLGRRGRYLILGYRQGGETRPWEDVREALDSPSWGGEPLPLDEPERTAVLSVFLND